MSATFNFKPSPALEAFICCCTFHFVAIFETLFPVSILKTPDVGLNNNGALALSAALARAFVKYKLLSSEISLVFKFTTPTFPLTLCTGAPGVNNSIQSDRIAE